MSRQFPIMRSFGLITIAGLLGLAACSASVEGYTPSPTVAKRPVAEWTVSRLDLQFEPGKAALAPGEAARFASMLALEDATRPVRVVARTYATGIAPDLAIERAATLRQIASAKGFELQYQSAGDAVEDPASADDALVYIGRYEVTVPGCPDWRKPLVTDFSNKESTNLGCANAMNLALMLADPGDLTKGQTLVGADGQREAMVVDQYRVGKQPRVAGPDLPSAKASKSLTAN